MNFCKQILKILILGISYNAIMHKCRFGQACCIDLLKRILKKFILQISEVYFISYEFLNHKRIFGIYIEKGNQKKGKTGAQYWGAFGTRPST
jgi:hypothetical protein